MRIAFINPSLRPESVDLGIELESVFKTGTYRRPADAEKGAHVS